ncbi:DUF4097 family beta strand repeat-containing protein [Muricauda sp. SCSIO 64092]|uniref:DUF4097 family beta strand repeat-containing protein n=1 Tax=Allomuricauda sp. SCSIO 64092 TaxID=2908842 RepID=UPI001FF211B2|nr:DUF4097 family beta strand repeat-containing protein [Muricauda sp. SCSIO 64092]UOY07899.1 DUF4097 family beta strand repeat-containing protein [Muricauda sp. SCSIO 64092]
MKQLAVMLVVLFLVPVLGRSQDKVFKETIEKELSFAHQNRENTLVLKNIFGPITVEGYSGKTIQISVDKEITARNQEDLELGKKELSLKVVEQENRLVVHPDAPYINYNEKGLRFDWCNNYEEPDYKHKLSFKVKVPRGINLNISTVNDGDIYVANTSGNFIKVNNINGGIDLKNVEGKTNLHCINGAVNVSYASNPNEASRYYSLNGDITITYQTALSADVSFKSMNGELFTDFDVERQYVRTKKETSKKREGKFKYESTPIVQIGNGGLQLEFETLNGNVFIKKI